MQTIARIVVLLAVTGTVLPAQDKPTTTETRFELRAGELVKSVKSEVKPEQSYALFVPSNYTPERRWPIIYAFDPAAHGSRPLELMKEAAERYGFLLAGSNNSHNGAWQPEQEAANAMWADTHGWLAIDDRRVYFAGWSGGARVAAQLAQFCKCSHGVFLSGAGFGIGSPPTRDAIFPVFATAGLGDYNYGELLDLDAKLESLRFPHLLRRFDGEHAWAPAPLWDEGFAWMALQEMKDGLRPRDNAFINIELSHALERVRQRETAGEQYFALGDYRALTATLEGLADPAPFKERIAALQNDAAVRAQAKQDKFEIERQNILQNQLLGLTQSLSDSEGNLDEVRDNVVTWVHAQREKLLQEKRPEMRRILQRVVGFAYIHGLETGAPLLDKGNYRLAEVYYRIAAEARPDWSGPHLSLARCHAALGDRKQALRDLQHAVEAGYRPADLPEFVKKYPKLAPLAGHEEFQKLVGAARDQGK